MSTFVIERDGEVKPATGNPTLTSLDGEIRAPLQTVLHHSWTAKERARFGVFEVERQEIPEGKQAIDVPTYEKRAGKIVEVVAVEDIPQPVADARTPEEKLTDVCTTIGITLDEMRSVILGGKA